MIIPHEKKEVISMQLSWSLILFLSGILVIAIVFSGYSYYWKIQKEREISLLKNRYGLNLNTALNVQASTEEGIELYEELAEKLMNISLLIGIREHDFKMLDDMEMATERAEDELKSEVLRRLDMGPTTDYLPPIYSLKSYFFMMQNHIPLITALFESINKGIGVFAGMPLGRPVQMSIHVADTSLFGRRRDPLTGASLELHTGMDTSAPAGTPVYATAAGIVEKVSYAENGYGKSILLRHSNGFYSLFAHLSSINVRKGQSISRKQFIGRVGRSGRTTGSHLHYEIRLGNSQKIDPLPYVCSTDLYTRNCVKYNNKHKL